MDQSGGRVDIGVAGNYAYPNRPTDDTAASAADGIIGKVRADGSTIDAVLQTNFA